MLDARPDIWKHLDYFTTPLNDDSDVDLIVSLHQQRLLPEEKRIEFVEVIRAAAADEADVSFLENSALGGLLTESEREIILADVKEHVLGDLDRHVERVRKLWDRDYNPDDHFAQFKSSVEIFAKAISSEDEIFAIRNRVNTSIRSAVWSMESEYVPNDTTATPTQQSVAKADSLEELFRDVDG